MPLCHRRCLARAAHCPKRDLHSHPFQRVHHRLTHMVRHNGLDVVVLEEPSHPGVM